jgi:hypothetical protein
MSLVIGSALIVVSRWRRILAFLLISGRWVTAVLIRIRHLRIDSHGVGFLSNQKDECQSPGFANLCSRTRKFFDFKVSANFRL